MKKDKSQCPPFEHYSDADKLRYKQKVLDISEMICSDDDIMTKLTSYTLKMMRRFAKHDSINGMEAQDFIQEAILKTVEGNRFWQGETVKELLDHYYHIIPSLIWNELKKTKFVSVVKDENGEKKIRQNRFVSFNPAEDDENEILDILLKETDTSNLDRLIMQETIAYLISYVYNELDKNNDNVGIYLFEAKINGVANPHKHVAKELNIPIEDVRNADKRLKRIINKAMRFYNEG